MSIGIQLSIALLRLSGSFMVCALNELVTDNCILIDIALLRLSGSFTVFAVNELVTDNCILVYNYL
jgi:hypothetical protein